ncbi:hypothetical protein ACWEPL_13790 [Nonomuraea sp. NPDC004186]
MILNALRGPRPARGISCTSTLTNALLHRFDREHVAPYASGLLGDAEVTVTMNRAYAETTRLATRLGRHVEFAAEDGLKPEQIDDLRAALTGSMAC